MAKSHFKFQTPVRVRWMECDAQGIVFFGAYMNYFEVAQSEYFRNLGFSIYRIAENGFFDTAAVKLTVEYKAPARVDNLLDVFMKVSRIGNASMNFDLEIYLSGTDQLLTTMETVHVGYDANWDKAGQCPTKFGNCWTTSNRRARPFPWTSSPPWHRRRHNRLY